MIVPVFPEQHKHTTLSLLVLKSMSLTRLKLLENRSDVQSPLHPWSAIYLDEHASLLSGENTNKPKASN